MAQSVRPLQSVAEALESVQFVVGRDGRPTGVFLDTADWEALLDWLEDVEDRATVRDLLPRLRIGPEKAGALRWNKIAAEWEDEAA